MAHRFVLPPRETQIASSLQLPLLKVKMSKPKGNLAEFVETNEPPRQEMLKKFVSNVI
jgi:hypothetical protein